jgi:ABC-type glycerol-3-phosphate transport system substrate-binding protein
MINATVAIAATAVALLAIAAVPVLGEDADDDEQEVTVKWADVPEAVRKTFEKEAPGVKIEQVEKETEDGKTTYEAEVSIGGKDYEIEVAAEGKLVEKEEADDDDDADDDD